MFKPSLTDHSPFMAGIYMCLKIQVSTSCTCDHGDWYLACDVAEAPEEVCRGVVISTLSLDWFDYNPSHGLSLLSPLHDQILRLGTHTDSVIVSG